MLAYVCCDTALMASQKSEINVFFLVFIIEIQFSIQMKSGRVGNCLVSHHASFLFIVNKRDPV